MNKLQFVLPFGAFVLMVGTSLAASGGFVIPGGASSNSILHAPGTTLDGQTIQKWGQSIDAANTAAAAAMPTATYTDGAGNITAPIASSVARIKGGYDKNDALDAKPTAGVMLADPNNPQGGGPQWTWNADYPNEPTLSYAMPGTNSMALQNWSPSAYVALTFRQPDYYNLQAGMMEHMAIGYGASLMLDHLRGYGFIEFSHFAKEGSSAINNTFEATAVGLQQSGVHFVNDTYQHMYGLLVKGSNQVKCVRTGDGDQPDANCTWPTGIEGQTIIAPHLFGWIQPGTTIVSGGGTNTITLSTPQAGVDQVGPVTENSTDGYFGDYLAFGQAVWTQEHFLDVNNFGDLRFYDHGGSANGGIYHTSMLDLARVENRIGMFNDHPVASLDIGNNADVNMIIGNDPNGYVDRAHWCSGAVVCTIAHPGSGDMDQTFWRVFGAGVNTLDWQWLTNPSRIALIEKNSNRIIMMFPMDGSSPDFFQAINITGGESDVSNGAFTDPDPGVSRDFKFGNKGIAVRGGTKTDVLTVTQYAALPELTEAEIIALVSPQDGWLANDADAHTMAVYENGAWHKIAVGDVIQ
ncbi:hypothetical protein AA103196_2256 [Ameyamaea chiangmaiensis NBRC 103196]|uniref:Uncharacterized protein n=1 Tax=Ameyamaea chiangmaiensis TaxID=442969 RepID=A0A850P5A2_9PROT|nr:hypothetical protein [Ameyamaea chiangmaiensis]MBS4075484.1 hypothetical protein [Ameyamaea chiangmaiensis]NVN38984.1 hypothetical protein [Ameyamaea chiangmaiensis]GBQ69594.1 hypothetical protein AA103196_2256 [Ameyamaea chiangmaiensis NBRC 103196]